MPDKETDLESDWPFEDHDCPVCGTDCAFVSQIIDDLRARIAELEAQPRPTPGASERS